ncbi:MAG: hypothetical protein ACRYFK_03030 [Janthinobacterium lividum]
MRATLLLLSSLLGLSLAGVGQVSPTLTTTTLLSGHLDQAPSGDTVRLWVGAHRLKAPVSPTGDFQLVVTGLTRAGFVDFSVDRQRAPLYLTPGDQLRLTLDYPHFDESLRFTGRGATANNYLTQARWQFEEGPALRPQDRWTTTTTPAQAQAGADAFRTQQLAFLTAYNQQYPLPAEVQQAATARITLLWARLLLRYPATHLRLAQTAPSLPDDYYAFLRKLPATTFIATVERTPDDNTLATRSLQAYSYRPAPTGSLPT